MEADQTLRSRIATYAETAHEEQGLTYTEIADKLGIDRSTLYRYRKGRSTPSKAVQKKMNRGGKLTQLMQNVTPSGDVPDALTTSTDEVMDRPLFAAQFTSDLGAGQIVDFQDVNENIKVTVTARQFRTDDGTTEWRVGPPEGAPGEQVDEREREFTLSSVQDERHLAGMVAPWLAEGGVIDSPEALTSERGIRQVT